MIWFAIFLLCEWSLSASFYVSNNGSDSGPGTLLEPFKTIGRAQVEFRRHPSVDNFAFIFPGTYEEQLVFTYEDSGQGFTNTFQNYDPKNKPFIFGGKPIKGGWVFDSSVKAYKIFVGVGTKSRQLFVNNRRAKRATGSLPKGTKLTKEGYQLPPGSESWSKWDDKSNLEFVENKHWVQLRCLVQDISPNGTITMQNPCWKYVTNRGGGATQFDYPTWMENNLELLNEPDEWYLNPSTGYLYYIPLSTEPIQDSIFYLPVKERLVYGAGNSSHVISGITIKGLVFVSATWMGPSENGLGFPEVQANVLSDGSSPIGIVEFQYGRKVTIEECVFTQLGAMAVLLGTGTQYCTIQSNVIIDVSSIAIKVGDQVGSRPNVQDQTGNNVIFNNKVMLNSQDYHGGPAVMIGFCFNCSISHNDISYTPYTGISHSWGWGSVIGNFEGGNMISNNLVNNTMMSLFDGGDFYTLGTQDIARSTCKENVFVGSHNCYGSLYLDDGSRYWDVYDNVVFGNVMSVLIKGGEHNIHDNWWQDRGKVPACGNLHDIMFEHNGNYCAPHSSSPCGPNIIKNNNVIKSLDQAPKSILDNAGLVHEIKWKGIIDILP